MQQGSGTIVDLLKHDKKRLNRAVIVSESCLDVSFVVPMGYDRLTSST